GGRDQGGPSQQQPASSLHQAPSRIPRNAASPSLFIEIRPRFKGTLAGNQSGTAATFALTSKSTEGVIDLGSLPSLDVSEVFVMKTRHFLTLALVTLFTLPLLAQRRIVTEDNISDFHYARAGAIPLPPKAAADKQHSFSANGPDQNHRWEIEVHG